MNVTLSAENSTNVNDVSSNIIFDTANYRKISLAGTLSGSAYSLITIADSDVNELYSASGLTDVDTTIDVFDYDSITLSVTNTYTKGNAYTVFTGSISFE